MAHDYEIRSDARKARKECRMRIKHLTHESIMKLEEHGFIIGMLRRNLTFSLGMVLKRRKLGDMGVMLGNFKG